MFLSASLLLASYASCQTATANLTGAIFDDEGAPLPGSTVLVRNVNTGFLRTDISDQTGEYHFSSLPVGIYDVTAQIQGFASEVQKSIPLDVARTVSIDFHLKLSTSGQNIEVSGGAPLIERTESHIATIVTPEQIANLPLNDRQFANLGVLAPGTALISNPDPTRLRNLAISSIGGSGRNLNVTIDGGDNTDDTIGGINEFYPLESIAEFNFLTNRYEAEYGRASGGVLNVVTKTGTNDIHGSFFSFFRDDALNALSKAEENAGLTDSAQYSRKQFGGSIGGPIRKDRAHFFLAIEREQLDIPTIVDTRGAAPEFDGPHNVPTRHNLYTAKLTFNPDPKQFLVVRYGQQRSTTLYGASGNYAPNAWADLKNSLHSMLVSHSYQMSMDALNELLFQYADYKDLITPLSRDPAELFLYTGVLLGQYNPMQENRQKKYQVKDDYSWSSSWKGIQHFKAGINFVREPTVGGTVFLDQASFVYTYFGSDRNAPIFEITKGGGTLQFNVPNNQYGIFLQDDWSVNHRLTLNLGIRYDYVTGFDLDQSKNSLYRALSTTSNDFPWLDPVRKNPSGKISSDKNNFAPRLGFAYDWKGDGTLVIRGGWGLYYDFPYTNGNILFAEIAGKSGLIYDHCDLDAEGECSRGGIFNPDGSLFRIGDPFPENQVSPFLTNDAVSPDFVVPYTTQSSIGFSRQMSPHSALDIDYVHAAARDRFLRFRFNGLVNGQQVLSGFSRGARFWYNGGFSDYNALNVTYRHQFTRNLQVQASYTLSKVTGNTLPGSDEFRLGSPCGDCTLDFRIGPGQDARMVGPLNTDATHRLVAAGTVDLPLGLIVSGIFRANSAPPFNAFLFEDPDLDGFYYSITDPHVNSRRGKAFSQLDLRVAKLFSIGKTANVRAILEIFNLFNAENPNGFDGDLESPTFGQPFVFGDPRQAQLGFRIEF